MRQYSIICNDMNESQERRNEFIKSFVIRSDRRHSARKKDLLDDLSEYIITKDNIASLHNEKINIEIGFGRGDFLLKMASENPEETWIGCDPYTPGVINILSHIREEKRDNILLYNNDARLLLQSTPDEFICKFFILFPDPWPKKRHYKRRLIQDELLSLIHRKIKSTGEIIIATDHEDYSHHIDGCMKNSQFIKSSNTEEWDAKIDTKYRKKALTEGRSIYLYNYFKE